LGRSTCLLQLGPAAQRSSVSAWLKVLLVGVFTRRIPKFDSPKHQVDFLRSNEDNQPSCRCNSVMKGIDLKFGRIAILAVCLILSIFMTAEVAHLDHTGVDRAHCQLCVSAHVAIGTEPICLTAYVLHLLEWVSTGEPSPAISSFVFSAFIRPPPASK
jgi:hypothetical protein